MIRAWAMGAATGLALATLAGAATAPGAWAEEAKPRPATGKEADFMPEALAEVSDVKIPAISLGDGVVGGKVRELVSPMGAGAHFSFRERRLFLLSGRGPTIPCARAEDFGTTVAALCAGDDKGRAYALPEFTPMIHEFLLTSAGGFKYEFSLPLRGAKGPVGALPNLPLTGFASETPYDASGEKLKPDPSGIAPAAIARLPDQSFLIGDANGPSLLHVAIDGEILDRYAPRGSAARFKGADYPVRAVLPAELARAGASGGITAVGASPDGGYAYFAAAAPLGGKADARALRIYRFNLPDRQPDGVWAYQLEPAIAFGAAATQDQVRLVDMDALAGETLTLMAESDGRRLLVFAVTFEEGARLSDAVASASGNAAYESLDEAGLRKARLAPLKKTLVFDSAWAPGKLPPHVEGVAVLALNTLLVANLHDGGLGGDEDKPQVKLITLASPIVQRAAAAAGEDGKIETGETPKEEPKKD
ncbi:esterase-like activity of phytase family protein [Neomegalonema sp.]|uniref:esterase-like activity of phytase family protein n=1 Tax=Neomegalonema sp. TaxID=2039713 RepID=UPI002606F3AF|nr:esterase-like activity of phytase family protein [Neomegalonema sp.]MDD2869116.1 esterase-like activity of phytase family protein [Neomegalonema sp.]